jgi:hypothetical protein
MPLPLGNGTFGGESQHRWEALQQERLAANRGRAILPAQYHNRFPRERRSSPVGRGSLANDRWKGGAA